MNNVTDGNMEIVFQTTRKEYAKALLYFVIKRCLIFILICDFFSLNSAVNSVVKVFNIERDSVAYYFSLALIGILLFFLFFIIIYLRLLHIFQKAFDRDPNVGGERTLSTSDNGLYMKLIANNFVMPYHEISAIFQNRKFIFILGYAISDSSGKQKNY